MIVEDDVLLKICVVGKSGVGKTNLISRYISNKFTNSHKKTTTVRNYSKSITVEYKDNETNKDYKVKASLQIIDIPEQKNLYDMVKTYNDANIVIAVCDVTNFSTLVNAEKILEQYANFTDVKNFVLIGNKSDSRGRILVNEQVLEDYAEEFKENFKKDLATYYTSVKTGEKITAIFQTAIEKVIKDPNLQNNNNNNNTASISNVSNSNTETPCCFNFKKLFNGSFFQNKKRGSTNDEEMVPLTKLENYYVK